MDEKVYLIHQTAREFLIAKGDTLAGRWEYSLNLVESEIVMARMCIVYLMFMVFDKATTTVEHKFKPTQCPHTS